jgi:RNA polymerase sigma-B factor
VFAVRQATSNIDRTGDGHPSWSTSRAARLPRRVRRRFTAELLQQLPDASPSERRASEDRIIELNLCVARDVSKRYRGRGIPREDLEQVAHLGLVKAVRSYDPAKATDLLAFAVPTIRGELRRHFRDRGWTVRLPRTIQELQTKVREAEDQLSQNLGRRPDPTELADAIGVDESLVSQAQSANGCFAPASLDDTGPDGQTLPIADQLGREDPGFAAVEARMTLLALIRELTSRERRILELRFWRGWTQKEIGADIGVTQMQVSRLTTSLLAKLRTQLEAGMADVAWGTERQQPST